MMAEDVEEGEEDMKARSGLQEVNICQTKREIVSISTIVSFLPSFTWPLSACRLLNSRKNVLKNL